MLDWLWLSALLTRALIFLSLIASSLGAHDMTPAYPEMKPSHVEGVLKAEMSLFNARSDTKYYQIEVFDKDWNNIEFASPLRIMKVDHKERQNFDVFIRKSDMGRAVYLCTTSKVSKNPGARPIVASKICSRLDGGVP